jgi:hypothetical protein
MFNPDTAPVSSFVPSFETAAKSLKVVPITAPVHGDVEIETAVTALGRESIFSAAMSGLRSKASTGCTSISMCRHCCPVDGAYDFSIALQDKGF